MAKLDRIVHPFLVTKLHSFCHLTVNTGIQMAIRCLHLCVKGGNVDFLGKKLT